MDRYSIILSTELISDDDYEAALRKTISKCCLYETRTSIHLSDVKQTFISALKAVQDSEDEDDDAPSCEEQCCPLWTEVVAGMETLEESAVYRVPCFGENVYETATTLLVKRLHDLAETIPKLGAFIDVFWLYKDEPLPGIEDFIEVYGALKCLQEWNKAALTFLCLNSEDTDENQENVEPWVTMLRGHVTSVGDLDLADREVIWRGALNIAGSNVRKPIHLSGFELISHRKETNGHLHEILDLVPDEALDKTGMLDLPRILSPHMDVIAQLDKEKIPLIYFTGQCCQLTIPSRSKLVKRSAQFIQRLTENPRLCYLVQLRYGMNQEHPECKENDKKTWVDLVSDNIDHVNNCPSKPVLAGDLGHYLLLLYANQSDTQDTNSPVSCTAHLLRPPAEISGRLCHQEALVALHRPSQSKHPKDKGDKVFSFVENLPTLSSDILLHLTSAIEQAQILSLQQWLEKQTQGKASLEIASDDILDILRTARAEVLKRIKGLPPTSHNFEAPLIRNDTNNADENNPDVQSLPVTQLERAVLEHTSNSDDASFGRFKSNESLAGLTPPAKGKVVVMLNAAEFLKCFKSDGNSSKENLVPLNFKKSSNKRQMQFDLDEMKKWPECENYDYHDLYYNKGQAEKIENRSTRLKSRLLEMETSSTCTYTQTHSPATLLFPADTGQAPSQGREVTEQGSEVMTPERITRGAVKRKEDMITDSKKLYAAKKSRAESRVKDMDQTKDKNGETRSQRHKRKLEEIVRETLKKHGVLKNDIIFKSCAHRLYSITKMFIKDLTSSVGLRQEMERIALSNVSQIVDFEKSRRGSKS